MSTYIFAQEGYEDLANAIVIRAAYDYRKACKRYRKGDESALSRIHEIERFFNSEWADLLCKDKAKDILWRLQREQEKKTKKPKRTVKIRKRDMEV